MASGFSPKAQNTLFEEGVRLMFADAPSHFIPTHYAIFKIKIPASWGENK
jgi:hypothetical protein